MDHRTGGERGDRGTPSEGGRRGGALLFGLVLVVVGGWTLLRALDLPTPPWGVTLSVLLIAAGSAIILTGRGGLHGGLLTLAIVLTGILALGAATFGGLRWESGFGDRTVAPMGYEQLEDAYQHSFGSMRVDLRNVELPPGTTAVRLNLSFGDLTVWLPPGVEYRIEGRTAFGEMRAERTPLTQGVNSRHAYETGGYQGASARLLLDIQSAFGSVEVRR